MGGSQALVTYKVTLEEEPTTVTAWIPAVPTFYTLIGTFKLWIFHLDRSKKQKTKNTLCCVGVESSTIDSSFLSVWVTLLWPTCFQFLSLFYFLLFIYFCCVEMLGNLWMVCLCICFSWTDAHIWAWMLNMPHSPPKEGAKALRESVPVAKTAMVRYYILYRNIMLLLN